MGANPCLFTPPLAQFRKLQFNCSKICLCLTRFIPTSRHSYLLLRFPTYPQTSNRFRATAIFKVQINSFCLIPTIKSFPPSTFVDFSGTTTRTDFYIFSHTLQCGLLRIKFSITLHSIRSLQLKCLTFPSIYLPYLPSIPSPICDFSLSGQKFAIQLPLASTSQWTSSLLAVSFPLSGHFTDLYRLDYTHTGRTRIQGSFHPNSPKAKYTTK